ncbi:MAG TPA: hypothetical protein VGH28_20870 [Polyangiaceae bacterium]|jgi:hypothetical protein
MDVPKLLTRDFRRTTLRPRHRRMVAAISEALFSRDGEPLDAAMLDEFVTDIDGFLSAASKPLRAGLMLMLEALRWLPVVVVRRFAAFEDLPIVTRTSMLERMDRSRFSPFPLMIVAFKTMLALAYFEDEGRLRAIGYPGEERKRYLLRGAA